MFESLTRVYLNTAALEPGSLRLRGEDVEMIGGLTVVPVLVAGGSVFGAEVFGVDGKKTISNDVVEQVTKLKSTRFSTVVRESQELIWRLIDHCTQSKYVFSMEWLSGGDMSMHRSNPYLEGMSARDVRRSTVVDDGPFAFVVTSQGNGELNSLAK
ncbi:hypothetical protein D6D19_05220 [Aureobasidium pullulans]|uniref:Uncharacterized protein n=1 Tax=Aureobasidium pullulans TaxID=5580 RepID=A0A4S9A4R6_AURPU|nr:hypothetical protein D6D19_05220 [Aureobasidium pullulans]